MTGETSGGGVIWICGLSGVGKTTLAADVVRLLRAVTPTVDQLDGDEFRKRYMPHAGYQREDRLGVAHAVSNAAWLAARKGRLCVVSTISLFAEIHRKNRAYEQALKLPLVLTLLTAPTELLKARRGALMREAINVVGIDIHAEMPEAADHQFTNDGDLNSLNLEAMKIAQLWRSRQARLARSA